MAIELEYNVAGDLQVYNRLLTSLPPGQDNLADGIVFPSNTPATPIPLLIKNVTPNVPHILYVSSEGGNPIVSQVYFVPRSATHSLSLPLRKGRSTIAIEDNTGKKILFTVSVTHYGAIFSVLAREINEHSFVPLNRLESNIVSSIGYVLASPLIAGINEYIPTDLEILGTLSNKLLIKNLLYRPGTTAATNELLAAFGASNPVFNPMKNKGFPETPLYRPEEHFAGFEAHMWLPNREVERWRAFTLFLNNLVQLYSVKQITEGDVYVQIGNRLHRHTFDFESDFANTVLDAGVGDNCFENLFRLDMNTESYVTIDFCQASYTLDTQIPQPGLVTEDTDLLGLTNFTNWTLSGRFEQQWDISYNIHEWYYDSPLTGAVDGINRYYDLSQNPNSSKAVKVFLSGLLLRLNVDYRISLGGSFRSGIFQLPVALSPILIDIAVGDPRPFLAPFFSSVEIFGGANAQYLVTATNQTLTNINFVISEPPAAPASAEEARLHYVSPALAAGSYGGLNQYGTETIPIGTTTFSLVYPTAAVDIDYQLFVQYAEDPAGAPGTVDQLHYVVRNHTLTGALVEFSEPTAAANAKLHWWLIEADSVALERGTVTLTNGFSTETILFTNGPYTDQVTLLLQLWNTTAIGSIDLPLISFKNLNQLSAVAQFSTAISSGDYRLDYAIFPSEAGNLIEIFVPPVVPQLPEAHYDIEWEHWAHTGPIEPVDGVRSIFTLSTPCPISEAMYAVLDGRLLTQGPEKQYALDDETTVRLNFIPEVGQWLWFVYPIRDGDENPPVSAWHQGFLTRQPDFSGSSAVGLVSYEALIAGGDTLTIAGETFTAATTARAVITNPARILAGDSLTFVELGVLLLAAASVTNPTEGTPERTFITCVADVAGSLNNTYFLIDSPTTGYYVWFNVGGLGTDPLVVGRTGIEVALNTNDSNTQVAVSLATALEIEADFTASAQVATVTVENLDVGLVFHTEDGALPTGFTFAIAIAGTDPTYADFEFPAGVSQDADAQSLVDKINSEPTLSQYYLAVYLGSGVTEIRALDLGGTSYNQTLVVGGGSIIASNIIGDSAAEQNEIQTVTFSSTPNLGKFNLEFDGFTTSDLSFSVTDSQVQTALNALPNLEDLLVTGSVLSGFTVEFAGASGKRNQSLLAVAGPTVTFTLAEINLITDVINIVGHGFAETDSVGFYSTGTLPTAVSAGTTYYIHVVDDDNIQLTLSPGGTLVDFTDGGTGTHTVSRNSLLNGSTPVTVAVTETTAGFGNHFAAGVSQLLDSGTLAAAINADALTSGNFTATPAEGEVHLSAQDVGSFYNQEIVTTGASLVASGLSGGSNPQFDLPMLSYKPAYYRDAPVISLDGLSTRLYNIYSGNSVQFTTDPVLQQEPYFISEVFPVEHHPMDSMVANQPCSYPKGLFTQGLGAQLTSFEHDVEQEGVLVISVNNFPLQEAPTGAINGVNTVYDMTFESCAGEDSMMLFIDGIFQPPTTYTYSVFAGHGRITLSAPLVSPQKIWVWYLPQGDGCSEEHVVQLTGVIDGVNQNFGVPSSPFVNKPCLVLFCDGLFQLQDTDYAVDVGNTSITYLGALAPVPPQTLWGHFNEGNIGTEKWRQVQVGVADGVTSVWIIPTLLPAELPVAQDSVLLSLDGYMQREGVDFTVDLAVDGMPSGQITFTGGAPEAGRVIQVAYIRRL